MRLSGLSCMRFSKNELLLYAVVAVLLIGGGVVVMNARGIRNNNPLNLRKGIKWNGLVTNQNDSAFSVFSSPEYGIRAGAIVLRNYQRKYGINTIRGIITRFAPPTENNTQAYIDSVSRQFGASPDAPLNLENPRVLLGLIQAIIKHENGVQPYTVATINRGLNMAGLIV